MRRFVSVCIWACIALMSQAQGVKMPVREEAEFIQNPMLWADCPDPDDAGSTGDGIEGPEELGNHQLYLRPSDGLSKV